MTAPTLAPIGLALSVALFALAPAAFGQAPGSKSTGIICWQDKSGRQVGCGYTVPPEYASNPTRELNTRGLTVKKSEGAPNAEALRAKQEEEARRKQEEADRAMQKKRDTALLNSYTHESEIDARRDRDVAQLDLTIISLQTMLKQQRASETELKRRVENFAKAGKPAPDGLLEDLRRTSSEANDTERMISQKRNEQEGVRVKYNELRLRFIELTRRDTAATK